MSTPRSFCNVDLLATYDAKYFGYLSKGDQYDGVFNKGFSDMIAPRSTDVECKNAFLKIVQDTHAQFGDMLAVAYGLLERVRSELQTDGGTASPQNFPIHMPVHLNGNDVKLGVPGWNLTSSVTTTDGTTVQFGHNRPLTVEENPEDFKVLLPKCGDKRIAELYAVGGSFLLLACGFTQEKTVRGGKNPFYLGPEILEKFGIKRKILIKFEEELNSAFGGGFNSEEEETSEDEEEDVSENVSESVVFDANDVHKYGAFDDRSLFGRSFAFHVKSGKFDQLSIICPGQWRHGFETALKKDNELVYLSEFEYEDVCYFQTQEEVWREIIRLGKILQESQTTMEPEGTGASESTTSETQHYVSTEDVDQWYSLSPEERANVPDPRGTAPSSKHCYSYAKQAWVLPESPTAALMRLVKPKDLISEKKPLSPVVRSILKQYEAMNFDPSFLRNTTFKYIVHYKETGEVQDRLTIALYDFGYTKKELDGLSLSQVVSELLAREQR